MWYYQRDLDQWVRMTAHLSVIEEGALTRLIDEAAINEQPLSENIDVLCHRLRAKTRPEKTAVQRMLHAYFIKTPAGYVNPWVQTLIDITHGIKKTRSAAGSKGGRATANARELAANAAQLPAKEQPLQDCITSVLQDSKTSLPHSAAATDTPPPAIEFPSGFPSTEQQAIAWARVSTTIIDKSDDWIREVWHQIVGQGFKAGNGVQIGSWPHWLSARARKADFPHRDSEAQGGPEKKKGAPKTLHPLDLDPAQEWRGTAQDLATEHGWTLGDITQTSWKALPANVRQLIVDRLEKKEGGAV